MNETDNPIRKIDRHFGSFIRELSGNDILETTAVLVSHALGNGNICMDLTSEDWPEELIEKIPDYEEWKKTLENYPDVVACPDGRCPLVFDGRRVYLHRYWNYEKIVAERILSLAKLPPFEMSERVKARAREWFDSSEDLSDFGGHLQLAAGLLPFVSGFVVISGGPGTGKTTVLAKTLSLQLLENPSLEIALAAPTGKAAARMKESLSSALSVLDIDIAVRERLSSLEACTIHRLLGYRHLSPYFRHNAQNPLSADLVVVDETSMVDLSLMAKLLSALKSGARLILLGDMFQLASVEAGNVLGDICDAFGANDFSDDFIKTVNSLTTLSKNHLPSGISVDKTLFQNRLILLKKSYRFEEKGGIGQSSRLINEGRADEAITLMHEDSVSSFRENVRTEDIIRDVSDHYKALYNAKSPEEALERLNDFKVLTALRHGGIGAEKINEKLEAYFSPGKSDGNFYRNKPILILKNNSVQNLFNGDTGVICKDSRGIWKAWFYDNDKKLVSFPPLLLPEYQTAYAITVHKSQGSEFDTVYTVLPDKPHPLVRRELIYTAITRARKKSVVFTSEETLSVGIGERTHRVSGLREALIRALSQKV